MDFRTDGTMDPRDEREEDRWGGQSPLPAQLIPTPRHRAILPLKPSRRQGPCSSWDPRGKDQAAGRTPSARAAATGRQEPWAWGANPVARARSVRSGRVRARGTLPTSRHGYWRGGQACLPARASDRALAAGAGDDRKLYVRNGQAPYPEFILRGAAVPPPVILLVNDPASDGGREVARGAPRRHAL